MNGLLVKVKEFMIFWECSSPIGNVWGVTGWRHPKYFPKPLTHQDPWLQGMSDLWWTPKHWSLFPDAWDNKHTGPQSSMKIPDLKQRWDLLFFPFWVFWTLSVAILSVFNKLFFCFLLSCVWFLSSWSQGPSWVVLQAPLWVLGPSQPPSVSRGHVQ